MVSNSVYNECDIADVVHNVDNTSNHSVIYMSMKLCISEPEGNDGTVPSKTAWYKASSQDINFYKSNIDIKVADLILCHNAYNCQDSLCEKVSHQSEIDRYFELLMHALINSSAHIPHTCAPQESPRIPGWTELVKSYRNGALFWKWLHDKLGRPATGWVAQIMRCTRAQYHYAIRCSRAQKEHIKRFKLLGALFSNDRDFFKEVKKIVIVQ